MSLLPNGGMGGAEFVSTVAYGLGHVSQFSAPNKDAVMDLIETAVKEAYAGERAG